MSSEPIADYALLSDCSSAALVSAAGSVDWLCFPRFDSPSVFGRILGPDAGFWSVRPVGSYNSTRRYLGPTLVLETTHTAPGGTLTVTDALMLGNGKRGHDLGADSPGTLLRQLSCIEGSVAVEIILSPRPEYGLARPVASQTAGGILFQAAGILLSFSTPAPLSSPQTLHRPAWSSARATRRICSLLLRRRRRGAGVWSQAEIARRLEDTVRGWTSWSELHQNYQGPWRELVACSGRILQALTYYPSGAIVAAATTSLPEVAGGSRNWDYRYSWIRDASITLQALWVAACPDEAGKFFQFLSMAAAGGLAAGEELQIMFGVGGERELPERELAHLPGWRASSPVRVGNGAWDQRQLDVYGELLDAAATLPEYLAELDPHTRRFLADAADAAATRWQDADQHLGGPRRAAALPDSKLMCWVALDRAISLAGLLESTDKVPRWTGRGTRSRRPSVHQGWSDAANAYTQSFGSDESGRLHPDGFPRGLPPCRGPAHAGHDRRHRRAAHRSAGIGLPLPRRGRP